MSSVGSCSRYTQHRTTLIDVAHNPKVVGSNPTPATRKPWSAYCRPGLLPFRPVVLPILLPALVGWSVLDEVFEGRRGLGLHAGEDVLVVVVTTVEVLVSVNGDIHGSVVPDVDRHRG